MNRLFLIISILTISFSVSAQKYVQVWGDEFNTSGLPDSTKWSYEIGKLRNDELQFYTSKRMENARIEDTVLIIEARKELFGGAAYTSASIISRGIGDWRYGKIEISAKVPGGKGTWPALWMLPTNSEFGAWPKSGEIDIMEYIGVEPQNFYFTTHFEGINKPEGQHGSSSSGSVRVVRNPWEEFIKFTMIWTPEKIEWYANDIKRHEYKKPLDDYRVWPFDKEFYLILNLAYGGNWGGYDGVDDTMFPHKFYIDYVRVYQLQETEGPFNLNILPANYGKVDVSPKLDFYPENTEVTLTAIPDQGYSFKAWEYQSGANPYTFAINKNTTVTPVFYNSNEILSNGDFSKSSKPWNFYVYDSQNISYSTSVADSIFVIDISKSTGVDWQFGFQENGLSLKKAAYKLTFDAWADQSIQLLITVAKNYSDWGSYINKNASITTEKKSFEFTLDMPVDDDNTRLFFGIGRFVGKFNIDNISLTRIEDNPSTGNNDLAFGKSDVIIYPNPTSGSFTIQLSNLNEEIRPTLELFSFDGKLLYKKELNGFETEINPGKLKKGVYLLKIKSENYFSVKKLVIN
ncbi:MAG TPA: family 16 glycosylhydrolase [Draconibacterium sp.]|nr:family 16 glycosylhydrolase [Draconibacterium sp.]